MKYKKVAPILMWLLPLLFFSYQFVPRLLPSLMMKQIMQQFAIDASAFGLLISVYYYGYAGFQIPVAVALDRYQPRYVISIGAVVCALSTYLFSTTESWYMAFAARFLLGAGSAVGFLGTSKIISQLFPKEHYTKMMGFTFTIGLMGAIYGGKPTSILIGKFGWYSVILIILAVGLALGSASLIFLRTPKPNHTPKKEDKLTFADLKKLLSSPVIWLLALSNLLLVGTLEGFADVWGVNYLIAAYDIEKSEAAELVSLIFLGMLLGGPILAFFSKLMNSYIIAAFCGLGMTAIFCQLLLLKIDFNYYLLASLFLMLGILCCYQVLILALGCDMAGPKLLGVTVAFLNCVNMLGGSFFHSAIGFVMDHVWKGEMLDGVPIYDLHAYKYGLLVIPVCSLIGSTMILISRFTFSSKVQKSDISEAVSAS